MECRLTDKKVRLHYSSFSAKLRVKCPRCTYNSTKKSPTYTSLRQLVFHLSNQHRDEGDYFPFTNSDIKFLMKMVALAKEWRLLA